jgi:hypothetical protein
MKQNQTTTKDIILAGLAGAIGGSVLALVYIYRIGGF